jgi:hypothetical protein
MILLLNFATPRLRHVGRAARVVDHDVEATVLGDDRVDERLDRVVVATSQEWNSYGEPSTGRLRTSRPWRPGRRRRR